MNNVGKLILAVSGMVVVVVVVVIVVYITLDQSGSARKQNRIGNQNNLMQQKDTSEVMDYRIKYYEELFEQHAITFNLPVVSNRQEKVLVLGIVQNAADKLPVTLHFVRKTLEAFPNSQCVIYENNSKDETSTVLKSFVHDRFSAICETISEQEFEEHITARTRHKKVICREYRIAYIRNKLLGKVESILSSFDYVMWIDVDGICWSIPGVANSLDQVDKWDILACLGMGDHTQEATRDLYYDFYAYRDVAYPLGPELLGEYWWENKPIVDTKWNQNMDGFLRPVFSAFSGLCLYRSEIFTFCRYSAAPSENVTEWCKEFPQREPIETLCDARFQTDPNVKWICSNSDEPVICEHVTLNIEAQKKGFTRVFINPKMIVFYC